MYTVLTEYIKMSSPVYKKTNHVSLSESIPDIMGYLFRFNIHTKTNSTLEGVYDEPIMEKIIPSKCGIKNYNCVRQYLKEKHNDTEDIYVIGLKYECGDSQPSITGKTKGNETDVEGALREVSEEIGGIFDPAQSYITKTHYWNTSTFISHVSKIQKLEKIQDKPIGKDNFNRRVEVVFYGTITEITEALKKIEMRPNKESDIIGIVAYPLEKIYPHTK